MHEADLVANTVRTWLDNPISRGLLRWVSERTEKGSKLESALKEYVDEKEKLSFQKRLAYLIVKLALDKGSESFGVSKEQLLESLKNPMVRRGIANILEGVS